MPICQFRKLARSRYSTACPFALFELLAVHNLHHPHCVLYLLLVLVAVVAFLFDEMRLGELCWHRYRL